METYGPYGSYNHVTHVWLLLNEEGSPQPWDFADAEDGVEYRLFYDTLSVTTDTGTQETTLTVHHYLQDTAII